MASGILSQQGVVIPAANLKAALGVYFDELLKKLTIITVQKVGPPKRITIYKFTKIADINCIHLPRFSVQPLLKAGVLTDLEVQLPILRSVPAVLRLDLHANQTLIVDHLMREVYTEKARLEGLASCSLNLRAGMGKTFVAAGIIARLGVRTLYVVPKRPLKTQAVKDLRACFYEDGVAPPGLIIGAYESVPKKRDPARNHVNQAITVIVIDSALQRPLEFFAGYSLVIFDEVHAYCTESRKELFWMAHTQYMLGMSATTEDRQDNFDPVFHKQVGAVIRAESLPGFNYENIQFDCAVKIINYNGPPSHTENKTHPSTGKLFTPYIIQQFLADKYRNRLILQEILTLYAWRGPAGQQHGIYVFCEERDPLIQLELALRTALWDHGVEFAAPELGGDIGNFVGGITDNQITHCKNDCRVLLTTYGYSGTGVSIDKMTAIIFVTPRKANMKQILARILRRGGDLTIPRVVVDVVDNRTALRYQVGAREIIYNFYDMKISRQKIKYEELIPRASS